MRLISIKTSVFFIVVLIALFLVLYIFKNSELKYHKCKDNISAQNCSDCEYTGQTMRFLVDKERNTVLQKIWIKTNLVDSNYLDSCIVSNKNNWICKQEDVFKDLTTTTQNKMIDGVFIGIQEYIRGSDFHKPLDISSYWCAK